MVVECLLTANVKEITVKLACSRRMFFFKKGIHMYLDQDIFQKEVSRSFNRLPGLSVHTKLYSCDSGGRD